MLRQDEEHREWWWLSSRRMTIGVGVDRYQRIVVAPPIVRRFIGQPLNNIRRWMQKQGGFSVAQLP